MTASQQRDPARVLGPIADIHLTLHLPAALLTTLPPGVATNNAVRQALLVPLSSRILHFFGLISTGV
jgi:hypothetical protein